MNKLLAFLLAIPLLALAAPPPPLEPYRHNFFTTNPAPIVDVLSGTPNVTVTPSLTGTSQRHFTVSVTAGAATNVPILVAGTNIVIDVNGLTNTISTSFSTNDFASSNSLWTASNSLAIYATGISNNVYAVTIYATGISNNVVAAVTYATGISNALMTASNALWVYTTGVSNNVVTVQTYATGVSNNVISLGTTISNSFLPLSGGTETGPVLSTSPTTNAPSATELATAGWVRSLFSGGFLFYASTNIMAGATNNDTAGQPIYEFVSTIPPSSSRSYVNPAALTYIGAVMTTNTFTFLDSPITVNAYLSLTTGGGDAMTVNPELYYSYDKTNWFGDWDCQPQNIVGGVTNLYQFVITFPAQFATNSTGFYIERRFRVKTKGGTPTLTFLVGTNSASGTNNASHITLAGPNSSSGNAYLANNQTFTGTNTFSQTILGNISGSASTVTTLLLTNQVGWTNVISRTNSQFQTVDMQIKEGDFQTNAAFAFLGLSNKSATNYQSVVITVFNSTASVVAISSPPTTKTNGVLPYNVTNISKVLIEYHPLYNYTNMLVFPIY